MYQVGERMQRARLRRLNPEASAADLDRRGLEWALVGGFAVSARAEPRFTRDVDVAVAVEDDHAAEVLVNGLIAVKLLARDDESRPQDLADLRALREAADQDELELARAAVGLIEQRGYHRGRDLAAALADL